MNNRYEGDNKYTGLKRVLAVVAAIGLWGVSMYFSYKGFEFESTQILWFGIVMALVVTVVELVFNTKIRQLNPTLLTAGVICYIYGIYTNITGFYFLQHGIIEGFFSGTNWLIPTFAGIISEVLPEALFAWGVGAGGAGDFIGNLGEMLEKKPSSNQGLSGNQSQNMNQRIDNYPTGGNGLFSSEVPIQYGSSHNSSKSVSQTEPSRNSLRERVNKNQSRRN